MSEPITLTEREVRCLHEVAAEIHRLHTELKRRRANAASASPPRAPGASAHPHGAGVESGPGQPIDICERLEASASEWDDQQDEDAILSREAAAEIRRLRAADRNCKAGLGGVIELLLERNGKVDLMSDIASQVRDLLASERRAGIEAAAKWHAKQREEWGARVDSPAGTRADIHRICEEAIRALADKPAPDAARKGG